ncbi:MAG: glycosyltransferase [Pirellulales bacterium]|nr:glycosyltransferase [Pirellulales bacterium]
MDAAQATVPWQRGASTHGSKRPWSFLVSTTGCAGNLAKHLGDADYSYGFVLKQLVPVLEELGDWQRVERPASSLPYAIERARESGRVPLHIALNPPQNCYFTPAAPTILFPFWEFPQIPHRDFGFDTRQNWVRMCRHVDLIITASSATAAAFRAAGVKCPIAVAPVPTAPEYYQIPAWDPGYEVKLHCRHVVLHGHPPDPEPGAAACPVAAAPSPSPVTPSRAAAWASRITAFIRRRISPRLADRISAGYQQASVAHPGRGRRLRRVCAATKHVGYDLARDIYHRHVCRWLSVEAVLRIHGIKNLITRHKPELPVLPRTDLVLSGLVYTSIFNLSDRRKNFEDLLTGFLLAFRDRPDVTLALKLATNPSREFHELAHLGNIYHSLGIRHRCRIVVITDYLSDEQMRELVRGTTYYLTTTRAEGACLPLQECLAAGRPAIAPDHSALADYIDPEVALVLETHPEPTYWPHDPQRRLETSWNRLVWSNLHSRLVESAALVEGQRQHYDAMAVAARRRMLDFGCREVVIDKWRQALGLLPTAKVNDLDWAA